MGLLAFVTSEQPVWYGSIPRVHRSHLAREALPDWVLSVLLVFLYTSRHAAGVSPRGRFLPPWVTSHLARVTYPFGWTTFLPIQGRYRWKERVLGCLELPGDPRCSHRWIQAHPTPWPPCCSHHRHGMRSERWSPQH